MKRLLLVPAFVLLMSASSQSRIQPFLTFPLKCADLACKFNYNRDAYKTGAINSVLDHSMFRPSRNANYEYGSVNKGTGDGKVVAFNNEISSGARLGRDDTCIKPFIYLLPTPRSPKSAAMTRVNDCGKDHASYDEHPGYDYYANAGVEVRAAAGGTVLNVGGGRCYTGHMGRTCAYWGAIGIDHGNGYITQYLHMTGIPASLRPGARVSRREKIGLAGSVGASGPHLHFEVFRKVGARYLIVDPYGWVGRRGTDPLYSAAEVEPAQLWMRER